MLQVHNVSRCYDNQVAKSLLALYSDFVEPHNLFIIPAFYYFRPKKPYRARV